MSDPSTMPKKQGILPKKVQYLHGNDSCLAGLLHIEYGTCIVAALESLWIMRQLCLFWSKQQQLDNENGLLDLVILTAHLCALIFIVLAISRSFRWFVVPELVVQGSGVISILLQCSKRILRAVRTDYEVTFEYDESEMPNDLWTISLMIFLTVLALGAKVWYCLILGSYFEYLGHSRGVDSEKKEAL